MQRILYKIQCSLDFMIPGPVSSGMKGLVLALFVKYAMFELKRPLVYFCMKIYKSKLLVLSSLLQINET